MMRPFVRERRVLGARVDDADALETEQPTPEEALARWQLVGRVHAAIRQLGPGYRAVLVLRDLEGYSGEETCDVLGLELATMKTRLHRARAQLRDALRCTDASQT